MRSALIAGVSIVALTLGGCSWFEQTTGIGGGQSSAQQATPVPNGGPNYVTAPRQAQAQVPNGGPATVRPSGTTAQSGSTTRTASAHHLVASNEVRQAQQKLKDDGDYTGKIDGLAGPLTHHALMSYQQKNSLKQTGRLDQATRGKLGLGSTASSGSSTPSPASGSSDSSAGSATASPSPMGGGAPGGSTSAPASNPPMSNPPASPQH